MPDIYCPQCEKVVYDAEALFCHFCGGSLRRSSGGVLGGLRSERMRWIWIAVAAMVAAVFTLTMFI